MLRKARKRRPAVSRVVLPALLLLCICAAGAGWLFWSSGLAISHPLIARIAEREIGLLLHSSCSVENANLSLFGSLNLSAVAIRQEGAPGCGAALSFPIVKISFRLFPLVQNYRAILGVFRGSADMITGTDTAAFGRLLRDAHLLTSVRLLDGQAFMTCRDSVTAHFNGVECRIHEFDSTGLPRRLEMRVRRATAGRASADSISTALLFSPEDFSGGTHSAGEGDDGRTGSAPPLSAVHMRNVALRGAIAPGCSAGVVFPYVNVLFRLQPILRHAGGLALTMFDSAGGETPCECAASLLSLKQRLHFLSVVEFREGEAFLVRSDTVAARCHGIGCRINGFSASGLPRSIDIRVCTVKAGQVEIDSVKSIVRFLPCGKPEGPSESGGIDTGSSGPWGLRVKIMAPSVRIGGLPVMDSLRADAEIDTIDLYNAATIATAGGPIPARVRLRLAAGRFVPLPGYPLKGLSVLAAVEGDMLEVSKTSAQLSGAQVEASGRYALKSGRLVQGTINLRNFDLGGAYRSLKSYPGSCAGTADIAIDLCPGALHPERLCGQATIKGAGLAVNNLPLQKTRDFQRIFQNSSTLAFSIIDGEVDFRPGRITIPGLGAQGDPLSFIVSGAIHHDGKLKLQLYGWLPARYVATLPLTVRESLVPELYNNYSFKCVIGGTFKTPEVTLDRSHYKRAVKGVVNHFGKEIRRFFKRSPRK